MSLPTVSIDEEGFPFFGELRIQDAEVGLEILENLTPYNEHAWKTKSGSKEVLVEAFDEPLVARQVDQSNSHWEIIGPYGYRSAFELNSLRLDEWDRFHGRTIQGIPFVFSRSAQNTFFNLLDSFDDDSICFKDKKYSIPKLYEEAPEINQSKFWTTIYQEMEKPGWDLGQPAPALIDMLPRLKLQKMRILVLGCGAGHDAAAFAQDGHLVTGVDFSASAIERAQKNYGHLKNIKWLECDIFNLPRDFQHSFDLIFEHTCYCAISPLKRPHLVKIWQQLLSPKGFFMGVFFVMDKLSGPPYGSSEWEIRERLRKNFRFLFWGRWQSSVKQRQGKELFVYAQKQGE